MKRNNGKLLNKALAVAVTASLVLSLTPASAIAEFSGGVSVIYRLLRTHLLLTTKSTSNLLTLQRLALAMLLRAMLLRLPKILNPVLLRAVFRPRVRRRRLLALRREMLQPLPREAVLRLRSSCFPT